jgi:hypothetical protein
MNNLAVFSVAAALVACPTLQAQDKPSIYGEVEISRGQHTSQLTVFIVNSGTVAVEFKTGVVGGGGNVPEGHVAGGTTGLKVVPRLSFKCDSPDGFQAPGTVINFQAPVFTNDAQPRASRPQVFGLPPGKRRLYYSFKMPTEYVRGEFQSGEISRRDSRERGYVPVAKEDALWEIPETAYGHRYVGAIPITRIIEVPEKKTSLKGHEKQ